MQRETKDYLLLFLFVFIKGTVHPVIYSSSCHFKWQLRKIPISNYCIHFSGIVWDAFPWTSPTDRKLSHTDLWPGLKSEQQAKLRLTYSSCINEEKMDKGGQIENVVLHLAYSFLLKTRSDAIYYGHQTYVIKWFFD